MKRMLFLFIGILIVAGCETSAPQVVYSPQELRYKKVLVMPFTTEEEPWRQLAYDTFVAGFAAFKDIEVIRSEKLDSTFIDELHLTHLLDIGPVDFAVNVQGEERRRKVAEKLGVSAIIFGSIFKDGDNVSLHIQMLDVETGELTLSFLREGTVVAGKIEETLENLAQSASAKTIDHIKENWSGTRLYRY